MADAEEHYLLRVRSSASFSPPEQPSQQTLMRRFLAMMISLISS
jgi:hypothetical protein